VTSDSGSFVSAFAWAIATNPAVTTKWANEDYDEAFDDLPYVISTVWDAVAGPPILPPEPDDPIVLPQPEIP
jgi:hypothetical protein